MAAGGAQAVSDADVVVPLIECCPGEIYAGAFGTESREPLLPETALSADHLVRWIASLRADGRLVVVGPAAEKYGKDIACTSLAPGVQDVIPADVVRLGLRAAERGALVDALHFQPSYLRASQAEVRAAAGGKPHS